jgi:hypothetical protein
MASAIVQKNPVEIWRICPAEDAASEASSASCYHLVEDVGSFRLLKRKENSFKYKGSFLPWDSLSSLWLKFMHSLEAEGVVTVRSK